MYDVINNNQLHKSLTREEKVRTEYKLVLTESQIVKEDTGEVGRRCENKVSDDRESQRENY